jgi:RNA polymerase sigma-70 factor, ECF subfamily
LFHAAAKQIGASRALMNQRMTDLEEAGLVRRCQEGDDGAFRELIDCYKDLVFALVARTVQDRAEAEDLAQEVFLRVYRGLPYFRGQARLSTWIYRITANLCCQERAHRDVPTVPLDERDDEGRLRREPGAPDGAFRTLEVRDALEKAIARLPARDRFLVAGHYLKGFRYEDLAEVLDLPLGSVKTQLFRAKRRLRKLLEPESERTGTSR